MNAMHERVALCFTHVFPGIKTDEIPSASTAALANWNSMAHVTLLSSLSEEFGVDFEIEDYEELVSYSAIVDYLKKKFPDA